MVFLSVSLSSRPCQSSSLFLSTKHKLDQPRPCMLSITIATKRDLLPSQKRVTEEIWQVYFGSLWDAFIDDGVAKRFKNSNGCQETGRGGHFSKRSGPAMCLQDFAGAWVYNVPPPPPLAFGAQKSLVGMRLKTTFPRLKFQKMANFVHILHTKSIAIQATIAGGTF